MPRLYWRLPDRLLVSGQSQAFHRPNANTALLIFNPKHFYSMLFSSVALAFFTWSNKKEFGPNDGLVLVEFELILFFQVILIGEAVLLEEEQRLLLFGKLTKAGNDQPALDNIITEHLLWATVGGTQTHKSTHQAFRHTILEPPSFCVFFFFSFFFFFCR